MMEALTTKDDRMADAVLFATQQLSQSSRFAVQLAIFVKHRFPWAGMKDGDIAFAITKCLQHLKLIEGDKRMLFYTDIREYLRGLE